MPKDKPGPSTERGEHRFVRVNKAAAYWDVHPVTIRKMMRRPNQGLPQRRATVAGRSGRDRGADGRGGGGQ